SCTRRTCTRSSEFRRWCRCRGIEARYPRRSVIFGQRMIENAARLLAALFALVACAGAQTITITSRGVRNVDNIAVDQVGKEFPIGGLSGITWRTGSEFLAVMDNSNKLVRLDVHFNDDA